MRRSAITCLLGASLRKGFLNHVLDMDGVVNKAARYDAVLARLANGDLFDGDDETLVFFKYLYGLFEERFASSTMVAKVFIQGDGERFAHSKGFAGESGMAEFFYLKLLSVDGGVLCDTGTDLFGQGAFGGAFDSLLRFIADVEMILYGTLAPPRDDGHGGDSCFQGLLDTVLDERFGQYRQHLFRSRFGGRKKASAVAGSREEAFLYHRRLLRLK